MKIQKRQELPTLVILASTRSNKHSKETAWMGRSLNEHNAMPMFCKIPVCVEAERFTPVNYAASNAEMIQKRQELPRLAILAPRRPKEHHKEKLNHFRPPGLGKSLNAMPMFCKKPICLTLSWFLYWVSWNNEDTQSCNFPWDWDESIPSNLGMFTANEL
jgi:hypothetical protein